MNFKELQEKLKVPQLKMSNLRREFEIQKAHIELDMSILKADYIKDIREFNDGDVVSVTIPCGNGVESTIQMLVAGVRGIDLDGVVIYNFSKITSNTRYKAKKVAQINYSKLEKFNGEVELKKNNRKEGANPIGRPKKQTV